MTALDLIDHPDLTARLLAAAEALPDATALLVLADRFAELGDVDRERFARRLAVGLVQPIEPKRGFGGVTQSYTLDYLTPDLADVAACVALLRADHWWLDTRRRRLCLLMALKVLRPVNRYQLDEYDPLDANLPEGIELLQKAAAVFLCRPPGSTYDPHALHTVSYLTLAEYHLRRYPTHVDAMKVARWRFGWAAAIAADLPPAELMKRARRHAHEERARRRALSRLPPRWSEGQ